ncbi:hypothetical protein [Yinghuangia seranimata]|uniref:hypothetical protein n=1 Tax=Yinghuangia seranimata TaxID=408067 RepID=UPI00248D24D2|nr:hypothetical protein [Yinghuangia seranimata]MDI2131898.1 hypothetical protein [Yinghuangia seranimata]
MTPRPTRPHLAVLAASVATLLATVLALLPAPSAAAAPAVGPAPTAPAASPGVAPVAATEHVVFVGVPGLMWSDVTASGTPNLYALVGRSTSAALSVRTPNLRGCPNDGWLTVGAGVRSTDSHAHGCALPVDPVVGPDGGLTVPEMPAISKRNDKFSYDPTFGLLAATVAKAGRTVTAVGPGAALATADEHGRSPAAYLPDSTALDTGAIARSALTLVDLGPEAGTAEPVGGDGLAPRFQPDRAERLRAFDTALGRIAAALPPNSRLDVAGISDDGGVPHLRMFTVGGPAPFGGGVLTATSTRYDGMVQITDIAPSLLSQLGIEQPEAMIGAVVTRTGGPTGAAAVRELGLLDVGAAAARTVREKYQFFTWLTLLPLLLFGIGVAWSGRMRRNGAAPTARKRLHRGMQVLGVTVASVPAATFLVALFPWEKAGSPELAIIGLTLAWTAVLAALAFAGPWRRSPYGPAGFAAAATVAVLAGDVATGSHLQMNTIFGLSPLVAGRFYGFGNVAWSVYGMVVVLAVAWPVGRLLDQGRRRAAVALLAGCGLAAIVVNGWPAFGSDFGGVLALVPGFAVLGLLLTGTRISWIKVGLIALGAVATITVIAVLDWMRPAASRSHLGKFVQQVLDGDAGSVLHRKVAANLGTFNSPVSYLIPVAMVLLLVAVLNPPRLRATALPPAYARVSWLRPALIACWITAVVGYAVNDSGIQIPSVALLLAVPLGAAVLAAVAADDDTASSTGDAAPPRPQAQPQRT